MRKVLLIALGIIIAVGIGAIVAFGVNNKAKSNNAKYKITTTNFASYDFLRAIIGDNRDVSLEFLLGPGKNTHSYEPTSSDMTKIQKSNLFVFVGGETEKWADQVMESVKTSDNAKVIRIADYVDKIDEKEIDGAEAEEEEEEEGAFDEHIWTSPANAIKMIEILEKSMEEIDSENKEKYKENADKYIAQIKEVDNKIRDIVDHKVRNRLIFADKMPMQYFIDYYGLEVSAAFSGCSTETEPSPKTITYLENKVREEQIPVILYIELNSGTVAETIANETNAQAMRIQTLHNVSLDDFNNGETWVSLMTRNLDVLKKALQ